MNESERESFLKGITTVSTSTSMSTVVPMPPKSGQPVVISSPPSPPPPQQLQPSESSGTDSQLQEGGAIPASSSQTAPTSETVESQQNVDLESIGAQQGTATVNEESDRGSTMDAATVHSSQLATAGSTTGGAEQSNVTTGPSAVRNHLRNYTIGSLHLDSYVDIFNILSAVASNYVDSEGAYVRRLSLDNYPYQLRAVLGGHELSIRRKRTGNPHNVTRPVKGSGILSMEGWDRLGNVPISPVFNATRCTSRVDGSWL